MKTRVAFLVRAWDLCYEHDPTKAISENLWLLLPQDISQFFANAPVRPSVAKVAVRQAQKQELAFHKRAHPEWHLFTDFVVVEFEFFWGDEAIATQRQISKLRMPEQEIAPIDTMRLSNIGVSLAQRLIVGMSLAAPGYSTSRFAFHIRKDGKLEECGACHSWTEVAVEESALQDAQPLLDYDPNLCLSWLRDVKGFWAGLPASNVDRSFCYFSHTFSSEFRPYDLSDAIWAIGAFDAFYCDTSSAISEKIKKRVPLIISDVHPPVLKKSLNVIYSDRSRLVHGDIKFVGNFFDPYLDLEESKTAIYLFGSLPTLFYILLRSFRYAVDQQIHNIDFVETLECN